jgi:sirohydrochlorin ferrochelatase/nitrous oxidase accessory protein NosD
MPLTTNFFFRKEKMAKIKRTYLRASAVEITGILLLGVLVLSALPATGIQGVHEWHVYDGESIQAIINNVSDGDTIIVHEGIYEEQLYIAKSLDLKAAEGESPEIRAPEPETLESYGLDFEVYSGFLFPMSVTPIIMVNGSSDDISVDITGFVIDGSSVTLENSESGICGIFHLNADGKIEENEIKNIWGVKEEEGEPPLPYNGNGIHVISDSFNDITIHGNNIHNYTGVESWGICILGTGVKTAVEATVTENTVTGARSPEFPDQCGIYIYNAIATVSDNIVSDHIYTEGWWYASGIGISDTNLTAQGNILTDSGIWLNTGCGYPHSTAFIENNTVDASEISKEECGPIAGIVITTFPPCWSYGEEPLVTANVEGNQLSGGPGSGITIGGIGGMHAEMGFEPVGTVTTTITRNIVSEWDYGIELLENSDSTVYLNDFVNNAQNVFVNESTNVYSSPEKIDYTYKGRDYKNYVGNYWSDYAGEDANADGTGDTPYVIAGDNPDEYPLMAPIKNYEQIGILVIAHGSPSESWCKPVREAVENVSLGYPTELGFLEFVDELDGYDFIHEAVDKLDEQGVTKIIAVPLFISSHSGHIAEIEYVLGLFEELPEMSMMSRRTFVEGEEMERSIVSLEGRYRVSYTPIAGTVSAMGVTAKQHHGGGEAEEEELVPVDTPAEIVLTNAIDDHWAIADILTGRVATLSNDPANETVVLVAHGTDVEPDFAGWVNSSESLAEQMKLKLKYGMGLNINDVRYSFVFPNETLHSDLLVRAVVDNVSATSDPIVVPLMVSEGHFTDKGIPGLLQNISYAYPEEGARALTPHPDVAEWIELTMAKELSYPPVQIYDGEELLTITIEDAGEYHGEGVIEICPCVASAFRSTLRAFLEDLWDGMPHRGDVKINSRHPSDGHVMTFEYILGSAEDLSIDEGADIVNITADNYLYTFTRKSTNDSVTIRVKEEIFPERFFELRTKCKLAKMGKGDVTKEENKALKMFKEELREKLMYLPVDSVFEESS